MNSNLLISAVIFTRFARKFDVTNQQIWVHLWATIMLGPYNKLFSVAITNFGQNLRPSSILTFFTVLSLINAPSLKKLAPHCPAVWVQNKSSPVNIKFMKKVCFLINVPPFCANAPGAFIRDNTVCWVRCSNFIPSC